MWGCLCPGHWPPSHIGRGLPFLIATRRIRTFSRTFGEAVMGLHQAKIASQPESELTKECKRYLQKTKSGCFCREDQRSKRFGSNQIQYVFPVKTNSLNLPNLTGFLWHFKAWFLHQPQRTESFPRPLQSSQNSQIRQSWTHVTCLKHQLSVWNLGQCMLKHNSHCQPIYSPGRPWLTSRNLSSMG